MSQDKIFSQIFPVACHTDNVGIGTTFVAIKGMKDDGVRHIPLALERGARTIVVERSMSLDIHVIENIKQAGAELLYVESARKALAVLSAQAWGFPARKLKIIAVTGTKGKTTTVFLLEHLLRALGYQTALLSSVHNRIGNTIYSTALTTQHPDYLHAFLSLCVRSRVEWVVMEVAAQAFTLYRTHGIMFDAGIFTNFSSEHTEFYANLDDYFSAKKQILEQLTLGAPLVVNGDDPRVLGLQKHHTPSYGITHDSGALYGFCVTKSDLSGISLLLDGHMLNIPTLMGTFNGYNVAMAYYLLKSLGLLKDSWRKDLEMFCSVPGRLNRYVLPNGALVFIDYAHTPSSYEAVFGLMRSLATRLIVVFGAGGERGKEKRPIMGEIASRFADVIILTSDNPRSERAEDIIAQIVSGIPSDKLHKVTVELDREKAIYQAYALSDKTTAIMLLGKGPDEYQIINGEKSYFSESQICKNIIAQSREII